LISDRREDSTNRLSRQLYWGKKGATKQEGLLTNVPATVRLSVPINIKDDPEKP
jgi:hypothetical protein